jgi:ferric-dicitrate binding protein FerR (iron transport regulator)
MDSQRFEELLGLLLDGEPSREELVELVRLTKGHPAREREIQAQLEAAEMIALSEDELRDSTLFTAALQGRMFEDPFVSRVRSQVGHDTTRVSLWRRPLTWAPWGVAAAAVVALMAVGSWPWQATVEATVAELVDVQGGVRWTGDGGRIDNAPEKGRQLSGGTIESLAPDSWATLKFPDETTVTISGASSLTISAPSQRDGKTSAGESKAQKIWHLKRGSLAASVVLQPGGQPLLITTPAATMEMEGTRFQVAADATETQVTVNEGRVRVKRATDGTEVDVPAAHSAVASVDIREALRSVARQESVHEWRASLKEEAEYGEWIDGLAEFRKKLGAVVEAGKLSRQDARSKFEAFLSKSRDAGSLRAAPKAGKSDVVYVAALTLAKRQAARVVLAEGSQLRITGRVQQPADLELGLGAGEQGGVKARATFMAAAVPVEGEFDIVVPLVKFRSKGQSAVGLELFNWFGLMRSGEAGLEITSVELTGPEGRKRER